VLYPLTPDIITIVVVELNPQIPEKLVLIGKGLSVLYISYAHDLVTVPIECVAVITNVPDISIPLLKLTWTAPVDELITAYGFVLMDHVTTLDAVN